MLKGKRVHVDLWPEVSVHTGREISFGQEAGEKECLHYWGLPSPLFIAHGVGSASFKVALLSKPLKVPQRHP